MTKEDKQLLLKDLCARKPYGVIVQYKGHNAIIKNKILTGSDLDCNMEYYKPYLRLMSSMTEEEKEEYHNLCYEEERILGEWWAARVYYHDTIESIEWLNKNKFDYRGLIPMGLAIEVTNKNNPYK